MDRYVRVVAADAVTADVASGVAWLHGVVAIEELDRADGMIEMRIGAGADGPSALVDALVAGGFDAGVVEAEQSIDEVFDAERDGLSVQRVGDRVVLVPIATDQPLDTTPGGPGDIVVRIDPGRAFGSGTHATTRLCLERVEAMVTPGQRVLDVGTGTGVLAIAAAKLGASVVRAIDIDPFAVTVAARNVGSNGVGSVVEVSADPLDAVDGAFDVVVANVLAGVLVELADQLAARLAASGVLVVSGILTEREAFVVDAFVAEGLLVSHRVELDGWVTLDLMC